MTYNRNSDFGAAIMDLKSDIRKATQAAIDSFAGRTGATPCKVDIQIIENTGIGDNMRRFCVGDVRVSLGEF